VVALKSERKNGPVETRRASKILTNLAIALANSILTRVPDPDRFPTAAGAMYRVTYYAGLKNLDVYARPEIFRLRQKVLSINTSPLRAISVTLPARALDDIMAGTTIVALVVAYG